MSWKSAALSALIRLNDRLIGLINDDRDAIDGGALSEMATQAVSRRIPRRWVLRFLATVEAES